MKRINNALILLCLLFTSNIFSQTYWYVQFRNNFAVEDDQIGVGEWGQDPYPYDSPHYEYIYNNEVVKLEAYDNQWVDNNNFKISFNDTEAPHNESKWEMIIPNGVGVTWTSPNQVTSFTANTSILPGASGSSAIVEADMKRWVRIKFSNQFSGTSTSGQMIVNSQTYTAPTSNFEVIEENSINFNAIQYYDINDIRYIFDIWSDNVTSRSRTKTLYFNDDNDELTAIYKGYPIFEDPMRGLVISGVREGKTYYIKLDWNEHPNSYVTQYHIYRYTKYGSVTTDPVLVATRNRGTTTFTDYAFTYAPTTGEYQVYYDVKAYFSPDGTTSPDNFEMVRGNDNQIEKSSNETEEELIKEYAVNNYPNPFNPTTTIRYQLPKAGHVQIKVFDALGKKVATLVNEHLESGRYEARFEENNLPSGMYIYTIKVNDYYASKKMLLIK